MNAPHPAAAPRRPAAGRPAAQPAARRVIRRRGTVLVIVIALLGALMLLGFLFLTVTLQEEQSSIYFGESAKTVEVDPNVIFNEALEQLVVGPADTRRDSVLWGGYKSLLPGMVGADPTAFDGVGVSTVWHAPAVGGSGGRPAADLDRDGAADDPTDPLSNAERALRLTFAPGSQPESFGPAAQRTVIADYLRNLRDPAATGLPAPDVDRTYPDLNNLFLSYDWVEPVTGARMVIPSFHRPQMLRQRIAAGDHTSPPSAWDEEDLYDPATDSVRGFPVPPWYTNVATLPYVVRPHRERRAVASDPEQPSDHTVLVGGATGSEAGAAARRFVSTLHPDVRVDAGGNLAFVPDTDPDYIPPFDFRLNREPFWRVGVDDPDLSNPTVTYDPAAEYTYDADPDNDGVRDAVWVDLGYPAQPAGDGAGSYVPMVAFTIRDASSLFDLNSHGNSFGSFADADGDTDVEDDSLDLTDRNFNALRGEAPTGMISRSTHGLTPDEVNPQYGLSGLNSIKETPQGPRSTTAEDYDPFSNFFDAEHFESVYGGKLPGLDLDWRGNAQQSRNLEWWFILHGRPEFAENKRSRRSRTASPSQVGRYGERQRLIDGAEELHRSIDVHLDASTSLAQAYRVDTEAAAYFPYPGLSAGAAGGDPERLSGDDDGNRFVGTRFTLPGLVFGGLATSSGNHRPMETFPEGVPLDRRGSGFFTDALDGVQRVWLAQPNVGANPTAANGLRHRFPLLADAFLPLQNVAGNVGFVGTLNLEVGNWANVRSWFGGTGVQLQDERPAAMAVEDADGLQVPVGPTNDDGGRSSEVTVPAPVTAGVLAGLLINPDGPAAFVGPAGPSFLPSLYGALTGAANQLAGLNRLAIDHPAETIRDFQKADGQRSDAVFGPDEAVVMHLSDRDLDITGVSSRLLELAPVSFRNAPHAQEVRRRFTTASFDIVTAAAPYEPAAVRSDFATERDWELSNPGAARNVRLFPPTFGPAGSKIAAYAPADPFRAEVRALLARAARETEIAAGDTLGGGGTATRADEVDADRQLRRLVRKISLNGVVERVTNPDDPLFDAAAGEGELRIRPVTPHPRGLAALPVGPPVGHPAFTGYETLTGTVPRFGLPDDRFDGGPTGASLATAAGPNGTKQGLLTWDFNASTPAAAQEWHARRDRQNLARDLYVLLYLLGGVDPANAAKDYAALPNAAGAAGGRPVYTDAELAEMAQFAVNVVDAMDEDPVRTLFVYDKDLSDGYTPYDDGYAAPPVTAAELSTRGIVAGVEKQEFALSEVLVNLAWCEEKKGETNPENHPLTEWDDTAPRTFFFAELAYLGAGVHDFAQNPALGGAAPTPGENWRVVVRDPRDHRQFRDSTGAAATQDVITDRAILPRAGFVDAQRPYYTIASADPGYATAGTAAQTDPRSRMRVNLTDTAATQAGAATDGANWLNLAPLPFLNAAGQNDPGNVLRDTTPGNPAPVLDLLVPGTAATATTNPTYRLFNVQPPTAADPDAAPAGDAVVVTGDVPLTGAADTPSFQGDLFVLPDAETAKTEPPVVEVLLQTRANPLRQPHGVFAGGSLADRERDNPWVTVDRMRAVTTRLDLYGDSDNPGTLQATPGPETFAANFADLDAPGPQTQAAGGPGGVGSNKGPKVASRVRRRPLLRASEVPGFDRNDTRPGGENEQSLLGAADNPERQNVRFYLYNSLGGHDGTSPQVTEGGRSRPFDLWQPHFDRPFAGPADLAMVPLYDAEHLTGLTGANDPVFVGAGSTLTTADGQTAGAYQEFTHLGTEADRQIGLGFDPTPQLANDTGANQVAVLNRANVAASRLLYPDVKRVPWQNRVDLDAANDAAGAGSTAARFNMWYRLLQHADTPRHTAEMTSAQPFTVQVGATAGLATDAGFDLGAVRRTGRLNLNTLSNPVHLAGLLDDLGRTHAFPVGTNGERPNSGREVQGLAQSAGGLTAASVSTVQSVADIGGTAFADDWYRSLLRSRDGQDRLPVPGTWDPAGGGTRMVLPGLADRGLSDGSTGRNAAPFGGFLPPTRSLAQVGAGATADLPVAQALREAIQRTPLRVRPQPTAWIDALSAGDLRNGFGPTFDLPRAFFGVGGAGLNNPNEPDLDFTTRYRLLNKVLNSATHRGNVFLCWIQVDYFNAREIREALPDDDSTAVDESRQTITRIGAKRGDSPGHRAAFLIDRSLALELLRADHLPDTADPDDSLAEGNGFSGDETRTYSFARDPLSGGVKFPWQKLILHRQRIQ